MDYLRGKTFLKLTLYILMVIQTSHTLLDKPAEESVLARLLPHDLNPADEGQITSCDFESPCSWSLSNQSSRGDWYVTTPWEQRSLRQGSPPITDHSSGTAEGHYLLLRPDLASRASSGCEFSITSPILPYSAPLCQLHLASFLSEPRAGNLSVSITQLRSGFTLSSLLLSGGKQNGLRSQWEELQALIGQLNEPFQVAVHYSVCGSEGSGTLAIDSLELRDCDFGPHELEMATDCDSDLVFHCDYGECIDRSRVCDFHTDCPLGQDEGFTCDNLPLGSHCSFDYGPCGWSVSKKQSHWKLVSGEQLDEHRDLLGNTLQRTQGHFIFLKVRSHSHNREASVQSPALPSTVSDQDCHLRFSLYLYGDFNGTVLLSVEEDGTAASRLVWERAGQWKDSWQDVSLQITDILNWFHLKVKAIWGAGSNADIAVDEITLSAACFETDLNLLHLGHKLLHEMDSLDDLDMSSPLPQPSASDVSFVRWWFTSCGASGPRGPTQAQCDSAYRNSNVSVIVGKEGPLKGVQMWRVPATSRYKISAYGAAGGKGAKNHNTRSYGIIISAIFPLEKGEIIYILIGQQGEDACPGKNPLTEKICLGESSVIEDAFVADGSVLEWAGGGGGGGGATYIFRMENGVPVPLLIAAGGGGKAYLEDPERSLDQAPVDQYENNITASCVNGRTGAAGGGGGWEDTTKLLWAGKSLVEGAEGGAPCPQALSKLGWVTYGGFGGGGGACSAGGGGGGYRGGDAFLSDDIAVDGQDGVSFIHPSGEMFIQPLAAMESHGEAEIEVYLNCSLCQTQRCRRDGDTRLVICQCNDGEVLAPDNITCIVEVHRSVAEGPPSLTLILAVVASTIVTGIVLTCASLTLIKFLPMRCGLASSSTAKETSHLHAAPLPLADYQPASGMWASTTEVYYRKKNHLHAVRVRLQSPEYKLSKIRSSTIMTDYNPNYCFAGKAASLSELKEVPRKNITLLRALGHGAFGEVYEGQVLGMNGDNTAMQVAIKTLPEICSEQDEMDFLMEALIMSKFNHQNIVRCIGVSLQVLPRFILLELMTGGDLKSFLRQNRPRNSQPSSLTMLDLLHMARDIALGCRYLEENHFIHRDIAARNCLLTCPGPDRVAKIGDFGMARDIYRASYYRKGGRAMLPVKWMPPEAFLEGIFTCKTDTWSFGVLLWEIFSLGYMPYPCKTNQEVLEFVTSGGRMDPPKSCPGPVYRIMTQCWQHCPEHRPNFSTILERISYCTQDPDVINTTLPVEYGPSVEEEGGTVIRPEVSDSMSPLLVAHSVSQDALPQPCTTALPFQAHKPRLLLQRQPHPPVEVATYREVLEPSWAEPIPPAGPCSGSWLQVPVPDHRPCSRSSSCSGSQKLKNKTKNLWNPTYGSWVLESFSRGKKALSHTQSMPLSGTCTSISTSLPTSERNDSATENNTTHLASGVCASPTQGAAQGFCKGLTGAAGGPLTAVMDLAKLQSFPCGNVNYAYDEQSYETESLPLVVARPPESGVSSVSSSSVSALGVAAATGHKPPVRRHASYGHEDVKLHAKPEKPTRDRDSGFSLSEDLSVTPV